jgi:short-subunit dehydrogenase
MLYSGQKITQSGHRFMMQPQAVVRSSLKAMLNEQVIFVPGIMNKLACFLPRLLPRKFALWLAFVTMNRAVEQDVKKL